MKDLDKFTHRDTLVELNDKNFDHVIEYISKPEFQLYDREVDFNKQEVVVKWKNERQVVFRDINRFYKIYEIQNNFNDFDSYIRHYLIDEYKKEGLDWNIQRIQCKSNNKIYDCETREKLEVVTRDVDFTKVFLDFSRILDKIEKIINTKNILKKVQKAGFLEEAVELKLIRNCSNKQDDYGIKNGKYYLLDDADFILVPIDKHGKVVRDDREVYVEIQKGCHFGKDKYFDNKNNEGFTINRIHDKSTRGYYVLSFDNVTEINNKVQYARSLLKDERDKMIERNAELLFLKNTKYGDFSLPSEVDYNKEFFEVLESKDKNYNALYSINQGRKMYQSEIWHLCYQRCKFCFNGQDNLETCEERQLQSIRDIEQKIKFELDYSKYNGISFIGGEFFQGEAHSEEVLKRVVDLFKYCAILYEKKYIGMCWITATLTQPREKIQGLFDFLDWCKINNIFQPKKEFGSSGLWICTSWDIEGRFHTYQQKKNWENNMKYLRKTYKFLKFTTNMILTGPMMKAYIEGGINLKKFKKEYSTTIFLKQPILGDRFQTTAFLKRSRSDNRYPEESESFNSCCRDCSDINYTPTKEEYHDAFLRAKQYANKVWYKWDFFPTEDLMRKFLISVAQKDPEDFMKLFNIVYRSDELHRTYGDKNRDSMNIRNKQTGMETLEDLLVNTCGHVMTYACYSDNNHCCLCLRDEIGKMFIKES